MCMFDPSFLCKPVFASGFFSSGGLHGGISRLLLYCSRGLENLGVGTNYTLVVNL